MALLPYPEGYDCVWIGADALGRIAAFVTAGAGPIPTAVLCLPSEEFEELEGRLLALPARTVATRVVTNPSADCLLELGERGLFVYDWGDHHRTRAAALGAYEKQVEPAVPIVIGDLSADLASAVAGIRLAAAFGEAALLQPEQYLPCIYPPDRTDRIGSETTAPAAPEADPLSSQQAVAFQWDVASYSGWGVYGINLLRHWSLRPDLAVACSRPIVSENLDLDPLELAMIEPALRRSRELGEQLAARAGTFVQAPFAVLHGLSADLQPIPAAHGVQLAGTPTIGITFMESALVPPAMRERAKAYPLIVVGSRWNQAVLKAAGIDQTALVLQGIDPTLFHPAPRADVFGDRFVIFSGGKLERRKGQDIVLRAFRRFAARHDDALLMTAWASPWGSKALNVNDASDLVPLRLTAEDRADTLGWTTANGLAPHQVVHFSSLPNARVARILREADVALFPNRAEGGTNLAAMEAIACGLPTILSANTGHLDLVEAGGCFPLHRQSPTPGSEAEGYCDSDIDEIVETLETIYRDREAARAVARQGAARMMELSWARQLDLLAATIRPYLGRA